MKMSIYTAFYDSHAFFRWCMASVFAQTHKDWEWCISVDPESPELALIDSLPHEPRLKVEIRKRRGTLGEAKQAAVEMCEGELVVPLDSDDQLMPHALSSYEVHACPEVDLYAAMYSDIRIGRDGFPGMRHENIMPKLGLTDLEREPWSLGNAKCYRRKTVLAVGGYEPDWTWGEDWGLDVRMRRCGPVRFIDDCLYLMYRFADRRPPADSMERLRVVQKALGLVS